MPENNHRASTNVEVNNHSQAIAEFGHQESNRETWSLLHREAYVIGGGLADGVGQSVKDAANDLPGTGLKIGTAALLGAGLSYWKESSGMGRIGAMVVGGAFTIALAKDVLTRAVPTYAAIKDAAWSSKNLDEDRKVVAGTTGPFVVDWALGSFGGMLGAGSMRLYKTRFGPANAGVAAAEAEAVAAIVPLGKSALASESVESMGVEATRAATPASKVVDSCSVSEIPGAQAVYQRVLPSMLKLESIRPDGRSPYTGSAVVVNSDGFALTNHHVIAHSQKLLATAPDGSRYVAQVLKTDPGLDLALIKLVRWCELPSGRHEIVNGFDPIRFAEQGELRPGQRVFGVGYGNGAPHSSPKLSDGRFGATEVAPSYVKDLPSTMRSTEIVNVSNLQLEPGFSGGPLLTEKGELAALNFAASQTDSTSYSIPSRALQEFMARRTETPDYSKFVPLLNSAERDLVCPSWSGKAEELAALYELARRGIVQIVTRDVTADAQPLYSTAFAVDKFTALTDSMVVPGVGSPVQVVHKGIVQDFFRVEQKFPELGVAVLRSDRMSPLNLEPLTVAPGRTAIARGQQLVSFGFASNQAEMTASPGVYVAGKRPLLETDIPVDPGYAGAPTFNRLGQVVGMNLYVPEFAQESTNIHSGSLNSILRRLGIL